MNSLKNIISFSVLFAMSLLLLAYNTPEKPFTLTVNKYELYHSDSILHKGDGPFDTWLGLNISFAPIKKLKFEISNSLFGNEISLDGLSPRTEAHITVLTPVEYTKHFTKDVVPIEDIFDLAEEHRLQDMEYDILNIGFFSAPIDGKEEQTYFLILKSNELIELRKDLKSLALDNYLDLASSGDNKYTKGQLKKIYESILAFNPESFEPHITIGYTRQDLHKIPHGAVKTNESRDPRFNLIIK